jgi:hypothetical protein
MTKEEFAGLFDRALDAAADYAGQRLQRPIPRNFEIEMHGLSRSSQLVSKDRAVELLYLGPNVFYRIVDLSLVAIAGNISRIFVRVSGHKPGAWSETWNQPSGSGPFKQLLAENIIVTGGAPSGGG